MQASEILPVRQWLGDPVAYTFEAATHCPDCTGARFTARDDLGFIPESVTDREGNGIGAIFPWDTSDWPEGIYCDTCLREISEPFEEIAASPCYCPGDCNCHHTGAPYNRTNYCGCKAHATV